MLKDVRNWIETPTYVQKIAQTAHTPFVMLGIIIRIVCMLHLSGESCRYSLKQFKQTT